MFDVAPDDIAALNDKDLRELVARLCEAELAASGRSTVGVSWGGSQTAPDGGLDVRVTQEAGAPTGGFIPRASTGFQVKLPDMQPAEILAEMRPNGVVRPAIEQLAAEGGAYIIVCSKGSVADSALTRRREAMSEATKSLAQRDHLYLDFYDRTRLATWVRRYPGLVAWVRERLDRRADGWHGFGAWSYPAEGVSAEYLSDDKLRVNFGRQDDGSARTIESAIDDLRDILKAERSVVRLVGLSGVGKTRLVQALFDNRFGARPLAQALAVYTNMSDDPNPQPVGMATQLIAGGHRAVLIVDNCTPDLHRRLTLVCQAPESKLSVLSVEYDVRDDQPEGTQVVSLETSSTSLIAKIVRRRFSHISQVDAATIAEASGGNARIAIALAKTVAESESISGLSDDELFRRLFQQRHDPNDSLLRAAKACSLLYSFDGEALDGADAELPRLARLVRQDVVDVFGYVSELLRRDLVQQRSKWRAVLPHAVANRLARTALEDFPLSLIESQLVTGGTRRTLRSFSRRLSFLHDHPKAVEIASKWLAPPGLLSNIVDLDHDAIAVLGNIAPIVPALVLEALERVGESDPDDCLTVWRRDRVLLRSFAYEPALFDKSAWLMARSCTEDPPERLERNGIDAFLSLFTLFLSGTHATVEQRLAIVERLLRSGDHRKQTLGLQALEKTLQTSHFSSGQKFEFGARSRDYGSAPRSEAEIHAWFAAAVAFIDRMLFTDGLLQAELKLLLSKRLRSLWTLGRVAKELDVLVRRIAADGFWREGWLAIKLTLSLGKPQVGGNDTELLKLLERYLRPVGLVAQVQALVLGESSGTFDLDEEIEDTTHRMNRGDAVARALGEQVAGDDDALEKLLPEALKGGRRVVQFGEGLAAGSVDRRQTWVRLTQCLGTLPWASRNPQMMGGFLAYTASAERELANELLDESLADPSLSEFLPDLQSYLDLDHVAMVRLVKGLQEGRVPALRYRVLMYGGVTAKAPGVDLARLLQLLASNADGWWVAMEVLEMRFYSDRSAGRSHDDSLLEVGRHLLCTAQFGDGQNASEHSLAGLVEGCLVGDSAETTAREFAARLKIAIARSEVYAFDQTDVITALLKAQPHAVLDAFFAGDEASRLAGIPLFDHLSEHRLNPLSAVGRADMVAWCQVDAPVRFALLAQCVDLSEPSVDEGSGPKWSVQARALLEASPDPKPVLETLIERFKPTSWSGSRAALMEINARLLDDTPSSLLPALTEFVGQAKTRLAAEVASERLSETRFDRNHDERFE